MDTTNSFIKKKGAMWNNQVDIEVDKHSGAAAVVLSFDLGKHLTFFLPVDSQ